MQNKVKNHYEELVDVLKNKDSNPSKHSDSYGGNKDNKLDLRMSTIRSVAKDFVRENENLKTEEWSKLLLLLSWGDFDEEKQIIGKILESNRKLRRNIDLEVVEKILFEMKGWSQVDSICQSVFKAEDMLARWKSWEKLIKKLSKSESLNKKRASLVLLTAPLRERRDERFLKLSFSLIKKLQNEEDKLITKAISWLLREMIKNYRKEVKNYLDQNEKNLPRVAVRETRNKLKTGKK